MNPQQNNPFDELFRSALGDHEVAPPKGMWENISSSMEDSKLDKVFKAKLAEHEVVPSEGVWKRIATRLPLNPVLSTQLRRASTIAGILLLCMLGTFVYVKFNNQTSGKTTRGISAVQDHNASNNNSGSSAQNASPVQSQMVQGIGTTTPLNNSIVGAQQASVILPLVKQLAANLQHSNIKTVKADDVALVILNDGSMTHAVVESNDVPTTTASGVADQDVLARLPEITGHLLTTDLSIPFSKLMNGELLLFTGSNTAETRAAYKPLAIEGSGPERLWAEGFAEGNLSSISGTPFMNGLNTGTVVSADRAISPGFSAGLGLGYRLNRQWSVKTEVVFARYNQRLTLQNADNTQQDATVSADYIKVPLTIRYDASDFGAYFGASYGIRTGSSGPATEMIQHELGLVAGVDYKIKLNERLYLLPGLRATAGTDATRLNSLFGKNGLYNTSLGIRLGFLYTFGKKLP